MNFSSAFPSNGDLLSDSSFINKFGEVVATVNQKQDVLALFDAIMLSSKEVIQDMTGYSQNDDQTKSQVLDSVMPLNMFGECITLGLRESVHQVKGIRLHMYICINIHLMYSLFLGFFLINSRRQVTGKSTFTPMDGFT